MIESTANPSVKYVRRLQADRRFRQREQAYVVEGTRWLADLLSKAGAVREVFYTTAWHDRPEHADLLAQLAQSTVQPRPVSETVMAAMSDTVTPAGVLAVLPFARLPWPDQPSFLLILDRMRTPGNLGTICRTAAAAGVEGVLLTPGTVDFYNPKVVRGSMGAHLSLPVVAATWAKIARRTSGMRVWLAAAGSEQDYTAVNWQERSALIVGSEAAGAGEQAGELATGRVAIPLQGKMESLNAAVAAGILLFEVMRQRRHPPTQP
jgi:TrmH family RNA methyltransferase